MNHAVHEDTRKRRSRQRLFLSHITLLPLPLTPPSHTSPPPGKNETTRPRPGGVNQASRFSGGAHREQPTRSREAPPPSRQQRRSSSPRGGTGPVSHSNGGPCRKTRGEARGRTRRAGTPSGTGSASGPHARQTRPADRGSAVVARRSLSPEIHHLSVAPPRDSAATKRIGKAPTGDRVGERRACLANPTRARRRSNGRGTRIPPKSETTNEPSPQRGPATRFCARGGDRPMNQPPPRSGGMRPRDARRASSSRQRDPRKVIPGRMTLHAGPGRTHGARTSTG